MTREQNITLSLLLLVVVLVVALRVTKLPSVVLGLFQYTPTKLDLTPINPYFDWTQLAPKINIGKP